MVLIEPGVGGRATREGRLIVIRRVVCVDKRTLSFRDTSTSPIERRELQERSGDKQLGLLPRHTSPQTRYRNTCFPFKTIWCV